MSRYNKYAKELDTLARNNFQQYKKAMEEFEKAEKYYKENKRPDSGWWNASSEMIAKASDAESKYYYAKDAWEKAQAAYAASINDVKSIRMNLEREIEENTRARADAMDSNAIELLKSGILKPSEYSHLLEDFKENPTMARIIGNYAQQSAEAAEKRGDRDARTALLTVAHASKDFDGSGYLEAFDYLHEVYNRSVNNPGMIGYWDEFTASQVENF